MHVLIIEDDECDFLLIKRTFQNAFPDQTTHFQWQCKPDFSHLVQIIGDFDICVVDHGLPDMSGTDLIADLSNAGVQTPMILLTGDQRPELDQEALRAGASDFLLKDRISATSISRVTRYCIARKEQERRLREMAYTDALTGLANRAAFDERSAAALSRVQTEGNYLTVLIMDLDDFKSVNDTYGHQYGDELLRCFAKTLKSSFDPSTIVARLGGDEFGVLIESVHDPRPLAEFKRKIRATLATKFTVFEKELTVHSSIGATSTGPDQIVSGTTEILHRADRNLYCDKHRRKFEDVHQDRSLRLKEIDLELVIQHLELAPDKNEFELFYQPKVNCRTGAITGLEALLRWNSPEFRMGPDVFIPIAEEYGLIRSIGNWVIKECCLQIQEWQRFGIDPIPVAINISPVQLEDLNFFETVKNRLSEFRIAPQLVEFELTEGAFSRAIANRTHQMQLVAALGCNWAIDDFGIGYSSLNRLHKLPISKIKIDRTFLEQLPMDNMARDISNAIISMARSLKMDVVAEGVEHPSQLEGLHLADTDELQGYHCYRPMSAQDLTTLLKARTPLSAVSA